MNNADRKVIEDAADRLEAYARLAPDLVLDPDQTFALAWDLKQIARRGTASEGI